MLQILIHSSKTMRVPAVHERPLAQPHFLADARQLVGELRAATPEKLIAYMKISPTKAAEVAKLYTQWTADPKRQSPAIDTFVGNIYSGLQVQEWSVRDRQYAHKHLLILSGLYGALRACDGIVPYRLEMSNKLTSGESMYHYWGSRITRALPADTSCIISLSAIEYTKTVLPFIDTPVITPKFLTISEKTGKPSFVTVHSKIACGAFASWLIRHRISDLRDLTRFNELGYKYVAEFSTFEQPVYITKHSVGSAFLGGMAASESFGHFNGSSHHL